MSNDSDLETHPFQLAYDAGVKAGQRNMKSERAKQESRKYEDTEAFMDGYWNACDR